MLAVIAAVLASLPLAGCGQRDVESSFSGGTQHAESRHGLSREDREVVARTALTVMARLAVVRAEVRADQLTGVAEELREAGGLTRLIAAAAPTFSLRERVRIARTHLSYEAGADVVHELVPIERELHAVAWLLPTREAEEHLRLAHDALERGDREAASANLRAVATAVLFQEIDLPLQEVDSDLIAARQALQLQRLDEVDRLLDRAESSLDVLTVWARQDETTDRAAAPGGGQHE